ncbi:MAG: MinD/ParA family protein [Haloferacaceae archaeon]
MSRVTSVALVGAAGGAGTTRTAVELAALLARDDRAVAVLDAAFATQGLADYLAGRLDPDLTRVLVDDADLDEALVEVDLPAAVPGHVACCPARAPFERVARAKAPAAAQAFEDVVTAVADRFDRVLVDVPPIAANQAIAAVNAADRTVVVAPGSARGADALRRTRDRLLDLGAEADAVLATRGDLADADAVVPASATVAPAEAPACLGADAFTEGVAEAAAVAFDEEVTLDFEQSGALERVRDRLG